MPYKLSATLAGHASDVRAVVSPRDDLILSASRDSTAISWTRAHPSAPFAQTTVLRPGQRYVNSLAYIPPSPDAPEGYVVTGTQDGLINVFSLASGRSDPSFTLIGHSHNVSALHALPDGTIISGSWDKTARVWKNFQELWELSGHEQAVWAVLALSPDQFLTGAADNTIKLWYSRKNVRTYTGHTQPVRGLVQLPDIGFASCANDSEIRVWTLEGDLVYSLTGHTSFVYSIVLLPNGDLASSGEDRTLRIWKDGECVQTVVHPAISVWAVSATPNGDIVTGASDGHVRVFSAVEERWASSEDLKAYEDSVANSALPVQQVGDVKKSDLPGEDALLQPGKKEGEVKMIRKGDLVEAHQWNSASMSWQKIGDVVDAVGSGRKQLYQGREYDYVFDVDVQEGVPPLKLPYNANENPFSAAQRFLQVNELPLSYLDEVVKFIEKNTAGVNISNTGNNYVDPFTGASRYQPAQNSNASGGAEYMDPFTGASRYRAQPSAPVPPVSAPAPVASNDPWTGGSRYSGSAAPTSPPQSVSPTGKLPVTAVQSFKQANIPPMRNKLFQFNQDIQNEISTAPLAMYPDERSLIDDAFLYLQQAVSGSSPNSAPPFTREDIEAILSLLERWPMGSRFPLIDLCRLVIAYCNDAYSEPAFRQQFFNTLFNAVEWSDSWGSPMDRSRETNILLLLRGLVNAFQDNTTLDDSGWVYQIVQRLEEASYAVLSKSARVALGTLFFNLSCVGLRQRLDPELRSRHLSLILQSLQSETSDSEPAYRLLVALGNTVRTSDALVQTLPDPSWQAYAARQQSQPLEPAQAAWAKEIVAAASRSFGEERVQSMAREIVSLL